MPSNKLITVFDWGGTYTIDETQACPCIDYAYHGYFRSYVGTPGLCTTAKWSPVSLNLGEYNSTSTVRIQAENAKNGGYGAMMCFNLRQTSDRDPLPVFQALSDGAFDGVEVICVDGDRPRDAGSVPSGYTITYAMATAE